MNEIEKHVLKHIVGEETKLAKHEVELGIIDELHSDVSANGQSADKARPLIRDAFTQLGQAISNYENIKKRNSSIEKNTEKLKQYVKELGLDVTDQFQKNAIAGLYIDKNIDTKIVALKNALSELRKSGEI